MSELYENIKIIIKDLYQGDKLPSERDLAVKFSVARQTISNTLSRLENEGYIWRKVKSGWFVSPPKFIYNPQQTYTFDGVSAEHGLESSVSLISVENDVPSEISDIFINKDVIAINRVKHLNLRPVMIEKTFVLKDIVPNITSLDLSKSLTDIFSKEYGVVAEKIDFSIESTTLTSESSKHLMCSEGLQSLLIKRYIYQNNGLVQVDYEIWRFDAISLNITKSIF